MSSIATENVLYAIMTDKVRKMQQFVIWLWWIDDLLEVHEDFIYLHQVKYIKAEILVKAIEDALLRLSVPMENVCSQAMTPLITRLR